MSEKSEEKSAREIFNRIEIDLWGGGDGKNIQTRVDMIFLFKVAETAVNLLTKRDIEARGDPDNPRGKVWQSINDAMKNDLQSHP